MGFSTMGGHTTRQPTSRARDTRQPLMHARLPAVALTVVVDRVHRADDEHGLAQGPVAGVGPVEVVPKKKGRGRGRRMKEKAAGSRRAAGGRRGVQQAAAEGRPAPGVGLTRSGAAAACLHVAATRHQRHAARSVQHGHCRHARRAGPRNSRVPCRARDLLQ